MNVQGPLLCNRCGRPTPYMLAVAPGNTVPCCGRHPCEVWLRDGVELPPRPPAAPERIPELRTIPVRELVDATLSLVTDFERVGMIDIETFDRVRRALSDLGAR